MSYDKEIINLMLAKADEKLQSALMNLQNRFYDDSASRSYYAVYHAICAVLSTKDFEFSSHNQTLGCFNKEFIKTGVFQSQYSKWTRDLYNLRESGDYDIRSDVDELKASKSLDMAFAIVNEIKKYLADIEKNL